MKKTLLLTLDFPPMFGGVANYWANLCRELPGDKLIVLAPEFFDSLEFDIKQNYLVFRKNLISEQRWLWPKWLPMLAAAWHLASQEKIEKIIVAEILPVGTIAYAIKKLLGIPYIVSAHGLDIAFTQRCGRRKWLTKLILRNAEAIIANSHYTRGCIARLNCCHEEKISVVYPCANINSQEFATEELAKIREKYNLADKRIILTVGRLIERKGHDIVIAAMMGVLKSVPNAVYLIIGQGPRMDYLKDEARRDRVDNRVIFLNDILDNELPIFYVLADVFVMVSRELSDGDIEGFGTVYLEANGFGKPVIAGRSGGAVEAVEHKVNGLVVDPHNIDETSRAIISLLQNSDLAKELGERGKKRVAEEFNWPQQAKKLIKTLE